MDLEIFIIKRIIQESLEEDIGFGDLTTNGIFTTEESTGILISKQDGIIAGLPAAEKTWKLIDENVRFDYFAKDGDIVYKGQRIAALKGKIKTLLTGERVALNFLQRLSGIATMTFKYVNEVKDYKVEILDTRKTTPGLRYLEKYAVSKGGGKNHRLRLDNAVMIKDNHINGCGTISEAVRRVRKNIPVTAVIEVETKNLEQVKEAVSMGVDIIMLDNMNINTMKEAVGIINSACLIEASGNITMKNVKQIAETGVDYISIGELTHSFKSLDISFNLV
jgi:nicotinate-nucleotide pyrophosphorylase (carboxylating)